MIILKLKLPNNPEKQNKVQLFNETQLRVQVRKIIEFLKLIKPHLLQTGFRETASELRHLKRDKDSTAYIHNSFNAYRLDSSDEEALLNYMRKINGEGFCLYYGVFDFDKSSGSNRVNNKNAVFTTLLPIDFDNISEGQYLQVKDTLNKLGLKTVDISTGHGYQMIILLNHKVHDKEILKKFTNLLLSKGFPCDAAITDAARIMRLPFTFNCKCLDKASKYYGKEEPIPIRLIDAPEDRYSLDYVLGQLNTLPDEAVPQCNDNNKVDVKGGENIMVKDNNKISEVPVEPVQLTILLDSIEEDLDVKVEPIEEVPTTVSQDNIDQYIDINDEQIEVEEVPMSVYQNNIEQYINLDTEPVEELSIEQYKDINFEPTQVPITIPQDIIDKYPDVNFDIIPVALSKMLFGTREGLRNQALLFMLPTFKNKMGYTSEAIERILVTWGSLCKPVISKYEIKSEIIRLYRYGYTKSYGLWTSELAKEYGYFDFKRYSIQRDESIWIPNRSLEKIQKLHPTAFKIYIAMMITKANSKERFHYVTRKELEIITGYSYRTISRHINSLVKLRFISRTKIAKKKGSSYNYYVNPYNSSKKGFTIINKDMIIKMFKEAGAGATKLYTYMLSMININKKNTTCWASQEYLGDIIGKTQSCVSRMTSKLHNSKFINKITYFVGVVPHCEYNILI